MDGAPTPQTSWRFFSLVISASLWISWYTLTPTRDALGTVCNQMKIILLQYLSCMALIFKLKLRQAQQTLEKVARTFTAFASAYLYFKATLTFFKVPKGTLSTFSSAFSSFHLPAAKGLQTSLLDPYEQMVPWE